MSSKGLFPNGIESFLQDVRAGKNFGPPTHQQNLDMIDRMRDEMPESMFVHLTESEVIEEYIHHYGRP